MSGETDAHIVDTLLELVAAHRREVAVSLASLREISKAHRDGDKEAVEKAFDAASKLSSAHNDLLRKMEKLTETYATKESLALAIDTVEAANGRRFARLESWQSKVTGGLVVVGAIGLANFVKVWTG